MPKYKVVFAMSYEVEGESENEAIEKASALFDEDIMKAIGEESTTVNTVGVNAELIE